MTPTPLSLARFLASQWEAMKYGPMVTNRLRKSIHISAAQAAVHPGFSNLASCTSVEVKPHTLKPDEGNVC